MSPLRSSLLALALLATTAASAAAEEMLVLDNGTILQGTVVREADGVLLIRLSGVGPENRVQVRRDQIVRRFTTTDSTGRGVSYDDLLPDDTPEESIPLPALAAAPAVAPLPAEEPARSQEGIFERSVRLAKLAFPSDGPSRTFLAILGFVVVLCLVTLGGRVSDVEGLTLGKSTALAFALCAVLVADVVWTDALLRADRGVWVVPLQVLGWVGLAAGLLRCPVPRAVSLLAFVAFTSATVAFASGALLVAV